jgi:hypothetical protein
LEEIARALAQDMIAITGQEREDILVLARQMTMDGPVPHALGFCPTCVPAAPQTALLPAPSPGGSGWTSAAAAVTSRPSRSPAAASVKASQATVSASVASPSSPHAMGI